MNNEQRTMKKKPQQELYLKVPYHIFNITKLGAAEKMLLAHIYSFGEKGCWQSNKTLSNMFMTTERTISRCLSRLKPFIYVKKPKGYYRTIWAKSDYDKNGEHSRQNQQADLDKNGFRLRQKCLTTNNNTIKENNINTTATPSPPLPKGAPALLVERDKEAGAAIKHFIQNFGKEKKKVQPMSQEEFDRRKAAQLKALSFCSSDSSDKSDLSRKAKSLTTDHQPHKEKN